MIHKDSKMLLVTGLARSGTTLLSECLDHHPTLMCIADPMNEFFKGFMRYAYLKVKGEKKSVGYPIDNFFFSGDQKVSAFIDSTDFNHPIPDYLKTEILSRIAERDGEYCPEIIETVQQCKAATFDGLFIEIVQLLFDTYGEEGTECFGVKTAWCEQLLKPLSRSFPNMSFVNIVRDPRAVIASNYQAEGSRFPLFLNIRDWRKSVYYNWKYQFDDAEMKDRFIGVRYEDLVAQPEEVLRSITDMIGVEYSNEMTSRGFKKPNSSYQVEGEAKGISKGSKDKWKEVLPKGVISQTEAYCGLEMRLLNYPLSLPEVYNDAETLMALEDISYESMSAWCDDLVQGKVYYEGTWKRINVDLELIRFALLKDVIENNNPALLSAFFYHQAYYQWLRNTKAESISY
jgi:hypothetical protein